MDIRARKIFLLVGDGAFVRSIVFKFVTIATMRITR